MSPSEWVVSLLGMVLSLGRVPSLPLSPEVTASVCGKAGGLLPPLESPGTWGAPGPPGNVACFPSVRIGTASYFECETKYQRVRVWSGSG